MLPRSKGPSPHYQNDYRADISAKSARPLTVSETIKSHRSRLELALAPDDRSTLQDLLNVLESVHQASLASIEEQHRALSSKAENERDAAFAREQELRGSNHKLQSRVTELEPIEGMRDEAEAFMARARHALAESIQKKQQVDRELQRQRAITRELKVG